MRFRVRDVKITVRVKTPTDKTDAEVIADIKAVLVEQNHPKYLDDDDVDVMAVWPA